MNDHELIERTAQVIRERKRGFYLDALELENELWRDLAAEAHTVYHEAQGGHVMAHFKRVVAAHRELA